jgi:hypothetical protein
MPSKSLTLLLILMLFGLSVAYFYEIHKDQENFLYKDYGKFYQATQFAQQGKSIYTKIYLIKKNPENKTARVVPFGKMLNPPFFIWALLPLGLLSYSTSLWIWSLLSLACGTISIVLLQKNLKFPRTSATLTLTLILAFFAYYPTFSNIQFGQITLILLPLVIGAWLAARHKNYCLLGILLGVAASLKIFLGLFILYFLWRREWRALTWFVIIILICGLLPLTYFNHQVYFDYYTTLQQVNWYSSSWNVSLYGFLLRLFGGNGEHNVALFAFPWLTAKIYYLLAGLLLLGLGKFLMPMTQINPEKKCDIDFAIIIVAMLLLSPFAWLYYFPLLIIPVVVLFQTAKEKHSTLLFIFTGLCVLFGGVASPILLGPSKITLNNVTSVFMLSSLNFSALLILFGELFYARYLLAKAQLPGQLTLAPYEWITLLVIVLIPSLLNILTVVNATALFGIHTALDYTAISFGN